MKKIYLATDEKYQVECDEPCTVSTEAGEILGTVQGSETPLPVTGRGGYVCISSDRALVVWGADVPGVPFRQVVQDDERRHENINGLQGLYSPDLVQYFTFGEEAAKVQACVSRVQVNGKLRGLRLWAEATGRKVAAVNVFVNDALQAVDFSRVPSDDGEDDMLCLSLKNPLIIKKGDMIKACFMFESVGSDGVETVQGIYGHTGVDGVESETVAGEKISFEARADLIYYATLADYLRGMRDFDAETK